MEEKINQSEVRQFRTVFPGTINSNGSLFGGLTMKWMDETAYISATRFSRRELFTIRVEKIRFLKTIRPDTFVELIAKVESEETYRINVKVEIFEEDRYSGNREKAVDGIFIFGCRDENSKLGKIAEKE